MSIGERREAVWFLETYGVSVQRACHLVQLHRSTFLYQGYCQVVCQAQRE